MADISNKIQETFIKLKQELKTAIVLRKLNGHFYVYKASSRWDKETKKVKSKQEYLGRITEFGAFVRKTETSEDSELQRARALLEAHGAVVNFSGKQKVEVVENRVEEELSETDKKILTCLSMNARMPISKLAKIVNINEQNAYYRIKALEKKLGIKYIIEVDVEKLGYITYLLLIKFGKNIPTTEELKEAFNNDPKIQFAAIIKGEYNIIAYLLGENPIQVGDDLWALRSETSLKKYEAEWNLIPLGQVYSFIPLRKEFFDYVISKKEWHRTREKPTLKQEELKHRELILLKELNENSIKNFTEIEQKNKLTKGSARYTYLDLVNDEIIIRPTITMQNLPLRYIGMLLLETTNAEELQEYRHKLLLDMIEYESISNKYVLIANVESPEGSLRFTPILNDGDLDKITEYLKTQIKGMSIKNAVITEILIGNLCFRRFDNAHSRQFRLLIGLKKVEPRNLVNYN